MSGHGGKRNGAGRRRGAATKKTVEVATAAHERGVSPLQVMLDVMERHYKAKRYDEAARIAHDAAPYMHPRLSAIQHDISYSDADCDEALEAEVEGLVSGRTQARPDAPEAAGRSNGHHAGGGPAP
jgi:hypothetical protein